jgi:subtilisin family serine protease
MEKFIVLRDLSGTQLSSPFGTGVRGVGGATLASDAPEPSIEVESIERGERAELLRDPSVVVGTPEIPTRLIHPLESEAAAAGDTAWGIAAVGADASAYSGADVTVAVLDTGIDNTHPAFSGVTLEEQDFSGSASTADQQGHGTHCAGTIFGRDVDGERLGIARGVSRALIGKVLGDDGSGSSEMAFRGINWAADQGAQVISMSLGFDFPGMVQRLVDQGWPADLATSSALEAYRGNLRMFDALMDMMAAREAFGTGAVVVAAAGNESRRNENPDYEIAASLPAASNGVVSVGALGEGASGFGIAYFSNTLPALSGPGVDIKSAKAGGGTTVMSGTSMACPHVAGVTALWWEAVRDQGLPATAKTVVSKLLANAKTDALDASVDMADRGVGLVRAP